MVPTKPVSPHNQEKGKQIIYLFIYTLYSTLSVSGCKWEVAAKIS